MKKGKIIKVTVVTAEGVASYTVGTCGITAIVNGEYGVLTDWFPAFRVMKGDQVAHEIRCVRHIEIEYAVTE